MKKFTVESPITQIVISFPNGDETLLKPDAHAEYVNSLEHPTMKKDTDKQYCKLLEIKDSSNIVYTIYGKEKCSSESHDRPPDS